MGISFGVAQRISGFSTRLCFCFAAIFLPTALRCPSAISEEPSEHPAVFLNPNDPSLDSIGDPLPPRAIMRFGTLRFQNPSSVNTMLLSPDDKHLIVMTHSHLLCWDAATGKELWRTPFRFSSMAGPGYGQQYICFEPKDSSQFYLCDKDLVLSIVSVATGEKTTMPINRDVDEADLFRSRSEGYKSVDISKDGKQFLVGGESGMGLYDGQGSMKWHLPNTPDRTIVAGGANRDRLDFGGDYSMAQFSPDGKWAAAVMSDARTTIKLIDLQTGKVDGKIEAKAKPIRMDFSPDGRSIYVTERDCGVRCYNVKGQTMTWELALKPDPKGAESYTSAIACSADGKLIAAGAPIGPKEWIYLIDAQAGTEVAVLKKCGWKPWAVQFSSDSRTLYASGWSGDILRWDVESLKKGLTDSLELPKGVGGTATVAYSPTGDIAFLDSKGKVRIVDPKTGIQKHKLSVDGADTLLFSPDGKRLFAGGTHGDKVQVNVWDLQQNELIQSWAFEKGKDSHSAVNELATDASGRYLAAAVFRQSAAYVWDTQNGKRLAKVNHKSVYGLAISPDAATLVTVGWD